MASAKDKPIFTTAIPEHVHEGEDVGADYYADDGVSPSGCFCFQWWRGGVGHRMLGRDGELVESESWVVRKLKKARELTEVVAGPKWKNLIRKIGGYWRSSDRKRNKRSTRFGYDAESYALNFDRGFDMEEEDELLMSHSTRFVGNFRNDERQVQGGIGPS